MESILVIDDEEDILDFMTDILSNEGYRVIPMNSGESAREYETSKYGVKYGQGFLFVLPKKPPLSIESNRVNE